MRRSVPVAGSVRVEGVRRPGRPEGAWWTRRAVTIADAFRLAVQDRIRSGDPSELSLQQTCAVCAEVSGLEAGIVLETPGYPQAAMAASAGAVAVEDVQFALGEGPGVDAAREGRPVLVPDLAGAGAGDRWMHFVPAALGLGVRAVFAYPLQVGAIRNGVLSLYAGHSHPLADGQLGDLSTLAGLVMEVVLAIQASAAEGELPWALDSAADYRAVVHQATGMVAMQADCSAREALARLRARAFAEGVGLDEMAERVVRRGMRFEP